MSLTAWLQRIPPRLYLAMGLSSIVVTLVLVASASNLVLARMQLERVEAPQ